MTREEAIRWIEQISERYIHGGDDDFDAKRREALNMAIKALRTQKFTLPNEPLTLNELREMEGQPVWIECTTDPECSCWGYHDEDGVNGYCAYFDDREYGRVWMAYSQIPESD